MKLAQLLHALCNSSAPGSSLQGCGNREARASADAAIWAESAAQRTGDIDITSVHYHSGQVKPGGLFVAITGFAADGHDYIDDAVARGAAAVITQKPVACPVPAVQVENARLALAAIAHAFYGRPSTRLHITGITGTNGKTTTAYLIESIMASAGLKVGVIGTVNYRYDGKRFDNPVTTPESLDLQRILAEMAANGVTHVVMEVSSHAIDLYRIEGVQMDMGVFTNLTQDHLDYHGDMAHYWQCKKRFFTQHLNRSASRDGAVAVVNIDNAEGREIVASVPYPCIAVGRAQQSQVKAGSVQIDLHGIQGEISTPLGSFRFSSRLIGPYNVENILCAAGAAVALNLTPDVIKAGIERMALVPGRLEYIANGSGKTVYVDYAHTPDALQNVLRALKSLQPRRLICVFGCGGDRDKAKRPQMGEIAGSLCDLIIVTSDNPRSEAPGEIIRQILVGVEKVCPQAYDPADIQPGFSAKGYLAEADRKRAIAIGVAAAEPGDIVLVAGKGHETYQIIGRRRIPFDDRQEVKNALAEAQRHHDNNPTSS